MRIILKAVLTQRLKQALPRRTDVGERPSSPFKSPIEHDISIFLLGYLGGYNIPTCLLEKTGPEAEFRSLTMIPLEVSVWNTATREYSKRLGLKDGYELTFPVIEHHHKRPDLGNPLLNEFHTYSLRIATPEQLRMINRLASKTNIVLRSFFERRELRLDKLGLEFGLFEDQIMVGNEISPRTSIFTDMKKHVNGRKDKLRGNARRHDTDKKEGPELYEEIRNRIFGTALKESDDYYQVRV